MINPKIIMTLLAFVLLLTLFIYFMVKKNEGFTPNLNVFNKIKTHEWDLVDPTEIQPHYIGAKEAIDNYFRTGNIIQLQTKVTGHFIVPNYDRTGYDVMQYFDPTRGWFVINNDGRISLIPYFSKNYSDIYEFEGTPYLSPGNVFFNSRPEPQTKYVWNHYLLGYNGETWTVGPMCFIKRLTDEVPDNCYLKPVYYTYNNFAFSFDNNCLLTFEKGRLGINAYPKIATPMEMFRVFILHRTKKE